MLFAAATISLLLWLYLWGFRDGYWRADQRLTEEPAPARWPSVTAVIPARDEAESIGPVIKSHMASDYPGEFNLILVDDHSADATAAIAADSAQAGPRPFEIIDAEPLPAGWTGKLWALQTGVNAACRDLKPDYLLLTDADIVHAPSTLRRLVGKASDETLALTSLMARLDARGFWGSMLAPAFIYFFQKLYPFPAANDHWGSVAAAAGGCMLVRRSSLEDSGGLEAIRGELIDDCALARQIKGRSERRIWLGLADTEATSLRDNRSLSSFWHMVARTAFTQLDYSVWALFGTVLSMGLIYLAPPLAVIGIPVHGDLRAALAGVGAMALMMLTYRPTLALYGRNVSAALLLPLAAVLYILMTASSAWRHMRGRGGQWKGRKY